MTNFYKQVCNFHQAFELPLKYEPDLSVFSNEKLCKLRYDLIKEEIGELNDAIKAHDFVEIIDALSDIMYVVYGCGASFGFDFPDHLSYCKPNKTLTPKVNLFTNIDMMTGLSEYTDKFKSNLSQLKKYIFLIPEMDKIKHELNNVLTNVFDIGNFLGIDLNKSYTIVHESNMTKLCKTEEEAIKTVEWYKNNEKRYDTPAYKKSKNDKDWIIYNESTNKILKSINYIPANFTNMLPN